MSHTGTGERDQQRGEPRVLRSALYSDGDAARLRQYGGVVERAAQNG